MWSLMSNLSVFLPGRGPVCDRGGAAYSGSWAVLDHLSLHLFTCPHSQLCHFDPPPSIPHPSQRSRNMCATVCWGCNAASAWSQPQSYGVCGEFVSGALPFAIRSSPLSNKWPLLCAVAPTNHKASSGPLHGTACVTSSSYFCITWNSR